MPCSKRTLEAEQLTAPQVCRLMSFRRPLRYHSSMVRAGKGPCVCAWGSTYLHLCISHNSSQFCRAFHQDERAHFCPARTKVDPKPISTSMHGLCNVDTVVSCFPIDPMYQILRHNDQ